MERETDDEPDNKSARNADSALMCERKPLETPGFPPCPAFFRSLLVGCTRVPRNAASLTAFFRLPEGENRDRVVQRWVGGSQAVRPAYCCEGLQPMSAWEAGAPRLAARRQPISLLACPAPVAEALAEVGFAGVWQGDSLAEDAASTLQPVRRAGDAEGAAVEDVGVDHRRSDVAVSEKLLDSANVCAVFEQVGGEGMPEDVAR